MGQGEDALSLPLPLGGPPPPIDYARMVASYDLGPAVVTVLHLAGEPWQAQIQHADGSESWLPWLEVERRLAVVRARKLAQGAGLPLEHTPDALWDFEVSGPSSFARLKVWVEEDVYRAPSTWQAAGLPVDCEALVIREGRMVRGRWRKATNDGKIRRRIGEAVLRSYLRNAGGDVGVGELQRVTGLDLKASKWVATEARQNRRRVVVTAHAGDQQLAIPLPSMVEGGAVEWVFD